jgi:hypothetical protein
MRSGSSAASRERRFQIAGVDPLVTDEGAAVAIEAEDDRLLRLSVGPRLSSAGQRHADRQQRRGHHEDDQQHQHHVDHRRHVDLGGG